MLQATVINLILAIAISANALLGLLIYSRNRKSASNRSFFYLTLMAGSWGMFMLFLRTDITATFLSPEATARLLFFAAGLIPISFLYFAYVFPKDRVTLTWKNFLLGGLLVLPLAVATLLPNFLVREVQYNIANYPNIVVNPQIHLWYGIVLFAGFFGVYALIGNKIYREPDTILRTRLFYILLGTVIPAVVGLVTNFVLPAFDVSTYNWVGPFSIVISTLVIAYGIVRSHVFDVRMLISEILMFIIWLVAFVQIALSQTLPEIAINLTALALLISVGILLIRSVHAEVLARDKIEKLATHLEAANERLRELDRQKSEFLAIAAHQLRTPLAAVKGYASMMLEGSYGALTGALRDTIKTIYSASDRMADTVDDFLNVSRIEQGRMEYRKNYIDLAVAVRETVQTFQLPAREKNLVLTYKDDGKSPYVVCGDASKIQHVINNLIDNAIKYTKEGSVAVSLARIGSSVRITITDTGAGIPDGAIGTLFDKFVRARNAKAINVTGSGLGLYVAREMIKVHGGKIWAESDGEGKGARFIVELPLTNGIAPDA